ncbi:T9SS type B sorting domain-containing protein [Chryseobacterium sp. R2A-55]|uniref:DUF7948 domain-containing protein n=1 Tax=Chryseobacterium sp. R2A-55 TaxID=2744445 RepID=UPI001F24148B|nr:T9SS type B sorting domain-containing protein [Chryseobacterium sp. R2A-55]
MKKFYIFTLLLFGITTFCQQKVSKSSQYFFAENKGQIIDQKGKENHAVKYLFHSSGLNVQIKKDGFSYDVYQVERRARKLRKDSEDRAISDLKKSRTETDFKYHRVDIDFVNANKNPEIIAEGKSPDFDNYYNIPDKPNGIERVHRYEKITYKNLYPKIDLVFFKPEDSTKAVEYNFIVNPGGRISDMQLKFNGAKTRLKGGKLSMNLRFGEMQENIPHSWEEHGKMKENINVEFQDLGRQVFGFKAEKDISDKVMVIDPVPTRIWGSYLGGSGEDYGDVKIDKNNNVYIFGTTASPNNIATSGTYQTFLFGGYDAFIVKVDKDGQRYWGTYYGRLYYDETGSLDTDDNLNVYAAIYSEKPNPLYPGNKLYFYPKIIFLKLTVNGTMLFNNEIGPEIGNPWYSSTDLINIYDLRFDNGIAYVAGQTAINGFGTPGAFQVNKPSAYSGFFTRFDGTTGNTDFFTYVGGNNGTSIYNIFNIDATGVEMTGTTRANDFPMIDPFQPVNPNPTGSYNNNGLYIKFSTNGNLVKSSYFGGNENYVFTSTRRFGNEVIFAGRMQSKNKICFYRVDTILNTILDYKDVNVFDNWGHVYVDSQRNIFSAGIASPNDPWVNQVTTPNAYQTTIGSKISIFLTKYDSNLTKIWSTFYQGNGGTQSGMMMKDYNDHLYLWGMSSNNTTGIATPGTFQQTGGHPSNDIFIAKFLDCTSYSDLNSNSPVCPGSDIKLYASNGANYSWTGPNGFTSNLQNPTIPNATAANAGIYSCAITGTGTCDGTFTVEVKVEDKTAPVPDLPSLPKITGNCKTIITTIPTATDACKGKITGTTTDPLQYQLPGNYVITWKYDDGNGNISSQTQNITITSEPLPTAAQTQSFCKITNPKISDIQITGTLIKWYDSTGNILPSNTLLQNGLKYYATQTLNGCESAKLEITVSINDPNSPTGNAIQDFCSAQIPKISDIVAAGQNIKWYDSTGNFLSPSTLLIDNTTYYASQTVNGCESSQKFAVTVSVKNGGIPANNYSITFCNDTTSNIKTENLNNYKADLATNPSQYQFEFYTAGNQLVSDPAKVSLDIGLNVFNVKISNNLGCFVWVKLNLTLNPKPAITLPATHEFCEGQSVNLDAGNCTSCTFEWTKDGGSAIIWNQQVLNVSAVGTYTAKVVNPFGCSNSASTVVKTSITATILRVDIINNTATVILSGSGDFLFSLDHGIFQSSNIFQDLSNGNHTVMVKTTGGCLIGSITFTIFNVSNVITPNQDGINDTWKIEGIENYPGSEIKIIDRYGTTVLEVTTNGIFEWDGKSNSRNLPTGSYWYQVKISDGRILTGWLLLKNRD